MLIDWYVDDSGCHPVFGNALASLKASRRTCSLVRRPDRDILWDEGVLLVRRSETENEDPTNKTKTGLRQRIPLPRYVMQKLRWPVETQLVTPQQIKSDLLFPSTVGGYRTNTLLRKPFAAVLKKLGTRPS